MKRLFYIGFLAMTLASCSFFGRKEGAENVAVELHGKTLTKQTLEELTASATSAEDSAILADAFIRQWASDVLFYDRATRQRDEQIEQMVEAYRRELYMKRYEERLVKQKMDQTLPPDTIEAFYNAHPELFVLDHPLVRGVLLAVPNGAPDLAKLRQWLRTPEKEIEHIEKYAYRYASGYELFVSDWKTGSEVSMKMPITANQLATQLRLQKQIELQDSTQTYLLQVTACQLPGEPMPLEVATPEIRKIILAERQVDFIQQQKDVLFDEAELLFRIKRYE